MTGGLWQWCCLRPAKLACASASASASMLTSAMRCQRGCWPRAAIAPTFSPPTGLATAAWSVFQLVSIMVCASLACLLRPLCSALLYIAPLPLFSGIDCLAALLLKSGMVTTPRTTLCCAALQCLLLLDAPHCKLSQTCSLHSASGLRR